MKKLLVAPVPEPAPPDDLPDFPEDVARLVAVAAKAGYDVSQEVAAHLWALHSADLCAGWLSANWNDESVLDSLLKHAVVTDIAAVVPTLPAGYGTWLDYAVDTVKLPASEVARLTDHEAGAATEALRDAARTELATLRRRPGWTRG